MTIDSKTAEQAAVINAAQAMCAAARTAPKTKGIDTIETLVLTDDEVFELAKDMERLGEELGYGFFLRDAENVRWSGAVVLIGCKYQSNGLGEACSFCGFKGCAGCEAAGGVCVFNPMDLGIAVGSAVSLAADLRMDNRVMFSVGKAAMLAGILSEDVKCAVGIPLSATGKSPFFDRKPKS